LFHVKQASQLAVLADSRRDSDHPPGVEADGPVGLVAKAADKRGTIGSEPAAGMLCVPPLIGQGGRTRLPGISRLVEFMVVTSHFPGY
jgi:hypothetical protein